MQLWNQHRATLKSILVLLLLWDLKFRRCLLLLLFLLLLLQQLLLLLQQLLLLLLLLLLHLLLLLLLLLQRMFLLLLLLLMPIIRIENLMDVNSASPGFIAAVSDRFHPVPLEVVVGPRRRDVKRIRGLVDDGPACLSRAAAACKTKLQLHLFMTGHIVPVFPRLLRLIR